VFFFRKKTRASLIIGKQNEEKIWKSRTEMAPAQKRRRPLYNSSAPNLRQEPRSFSDPRARG